MREGAEATAQDLPVIEWAEANGLENFVAQFVSIADSVADLGFIDDDMLYEFAESWNMKALKLRKFSKAVAELRLLEKEQQRALLDDEGDSSLARWLRERGLDRCAAALSEVAGDSLDLAFCDDATLDSLGSAVKALPKRRLRAAAQTVKKRLGAPSSLAEWLEWAGAAEFATTFEAIADDLDDLRELVEDDVNRLCPDAKPLRVKRILYYLDDLKQRPPVRRFSSRGSMLRASSARQSDSSSLLGVVADDVVAARESFTGGSFRESFSERGFALPPEEDEEEDDAAPPQDDDDDDDDDASTKECSSSRQHTPKTPGGVTTKTLRSRRQRPQRPRPPPPSSRARGRSKSPKPQPPPLPVRDYVVPTSESSSSSSSAADVPPPLPARDYLPSAASKTIEPIAESEDDEDAPPPLPVRDYERKHPMSEAYGNLVDIVFADGEVLTLDNLSMLADFHQDYDVPLEDRDQALAPRGWTVDDVEKILEYCNFLSNLGKDDGDSLDAQFRSQALAKFEKDNVILSDDRDRALHALDWTLDDYAALGSPLVASTPPGVPPPPLPPGSPARTSLSSSTSSTMTSRSRPVSERVTGAGTSSFHYNTTSETEDQVGALGMPPPGKSPPPPPPRRRVRTPLSTLPQRLRHTARSQGDKHSNLVKRFDVAALHAAIGNPPRLPLGQGGSARVFGGKLPDVGEVAIKRLSTDVSEPGGVDDRLFLKEVQILSKLRDPNVIRLLGFAQSDPTNNGGTTRMLVYELCKGGNLEVRLGKGDLSWAFRLEVARDAARGLFYLHSQQVDALYLHGDVKTANILLSARVLPAKLSDFGLARELDRGLTHASGALAGTIGYVCPAFARTGHLSPASDVYAMGVVFLSLVTGQKAIEKTRTPADLVSYARRQTKADVESWTQARRGDLGELSVAQGLIDIAWTCLADEPADRPTASELNDRLEELEHPHMTSRDLLSLEESAVFDFEDNDDADAQGTVKVLLGSFNVAGGSLNDDDLEQWLRRGEISTPGSSSPSSPAAGADVSQSSCADIVVVGLQECFNTMAPHHYTAMAGILQSHFSAGAPSSRGGSSAGSTSEEGAPLLEYVADASSGHTRLSMRLLVFVRKDRLRVEEVGKDSLTAGGVFKGCLASFLTVCDATGRRTSFIFANIHAPSGETKGDERNAAIHRATQRLKDIAGGGYRDATVFVFGDLNYRTNASLNLELAPLTGAKVQELATSGDWGLLASVDELLPQLDDGGCLSGFETAPCEFMPTSKLEKRAGFHYVSSRLPSYTDRVVWRANTPAVTSTASRRASADDETFFQDDDAEAATSWSGKSRRLTVHCCEYDAVGQVASSDHKPLRAVFVLRPYVERRESPRRSVSRDRDGRPEFRRTNSLVPIGQRQYFSRIRDLVGAWAHMGVARAVARSRQQNDAFARAAAKRDSRNPRLQFAQSRSYSSSSLS